MNRVTGIFLLAICTGLVFGCQNSQKKVEESSSTEVAQKDEKPKDEKLSKLEVEASRLRGGGSIKKVELNDGKALITYVKNFKEYKEKNPQSSMTKSLLDSYWNSGDAIKKMLVEGPVKIMTKIDYVNQVQIIFPHKGKTYSINLSKSELESFTGSSLNNIANNWDDNFLDPFVYTDSGREKFFKKFGKID